MFNVVEVFSLSLNNIKKVSINCTDINLILL